MKQINEDKCLCKTDIPSKKATMVKFYTQGQGQKFIDPVSKPTRMTCLFLLLRI